MEIRNHMQNHKIETNSELIYEDGSIWSTLIFIKIIGSDTLWFPLPPSEVLSNFSCLPERQIVQTQIRLIRVFPVCYSDKYFVNFSPNNQPPLYLQIEKEKCSVDNYSKLVFPILQLRTLVKSVYQKNNFLISLPKICCGYSKEPSQWDGSFEHPKHMLEIMGKKILTILGWNFLLI